MNSKEDEKEEYGYTKLTQTDFYMDEKRFYIYYRMSIDCFDEILNLIKNEGSKKDTNYREAICLEERLAIALRFLATGDSYSTIGHSFRVGFTTVGAIVKEVCHAICQKMQNVYMPEPTTEIWQKSAEGFYNLWQFANCIGSIDGKHITIKCPSKSGSSHFCYLKKFSIVLMAIVGPEDIHFCASISGDLAKTATAAFLKNQTWEEDLQQV